MASRLEEELRKEAEKAGLSPKQIMEILEESMESRSSIEEGEGCPRCGCEPCECRRGK